MCDVSGYLYCTYFWSFVFFSTPHKSSNFPRLLTLPNPDLIAILPMNMMDSQPAPSGSSQPPVQPGDLNPAPFIILQTTVSLISPVGPLESPSLDKDRSSAGREDEVDDSSLSDEDPAADMDLVTHETPHVKVPRESHADHWDEVISYDSPWKDWTDPGLGGWMNRFCELHEKSLTNDALSRCALTQQWLQKLAGLRRRDLPALDDPFLGGASAGRPVVPLFAGDDDGDEYQLRLHLRDFLAGVRCPAAAPAVQRVDSADPLVQIRYRLPPPPPTTPDPPVLPRFGIPLGTLAVRTKARYPEHWLSDEPLTERTDYGVMLDPESEAMPLWLLCSRRQLRDRDEENGWHVPQLPIFKGLMKKSDDYGYDAACILDSVHRIGAQGPDRPTFEETCELVRRTRAVVDPGSMYASKKMLEEIVGEPLPEFFNETIESRRAFFPKTKGK